MAAAKKSKPYCRSCRVFLGYYSFDNMHVYVCAKCSSKLVHLEELDRKVSRRTVTQFRELAKSSKAKSSIDCGHCGKDMCIVQLPDSEVAVDICTACDAIWFGGAQNEYERFLLEEISLKPSTKEMIERHKASTLAHDAAFVRDNYNRIYRPLLTSHIYDNDDDLVHTPHLSGVLFVLMILITFVTLRRPDLFYAMAYSNVTSLGQQVLTTFTSFFVHGSWGHLIGNGLFYYLFADRVERLIGTANFLELLGGALICNTVFQMFWYKGTSITAVGASVGITALMAYYVCADPYRPFRTMFLFRRLFRLRFDYFVSIIPAWLYLVLYGVKEVMSLNQQFRGLTNVSHSGHLIGLAVGVLFFIFVPPKKRAQSVSNSPHST